MNCDSSLLQVGREKLSFAPRRESMVVKFLAVR